MASDTKYGVHMLFNSGPASLGDGYSADSLKNYIDEAIRLGSDAIRFPGDWNALEPRRGEWNRAYIENVREAVGYAGENGVDVVMLFAQTPDWARPDPSDSIWHVPEEVDDFANAMAYFYEELADVNDSISAWEVWNEPNVFEFWGSADRATDLRQVDGRGSFVLIDTSLASEYVELLNAAYVSLHDAATTAGTEVTVLGSSTAGTDFQYVEAMLAAGAQFDGFAVHPYTRVNDTPGVENYGVPWSPDATEAQLEDSDRPILNELWSFEYGMNRVRDLIDREVWITEFGWSLGDDWGEVPVGLRDDYMERGLELIQGWDDVPTAIAYRLFDDGAGDFGLLEADGSLREAGEVFQRFAGVAVEVEATVTPATTTESVKSEGATPTTTASGETVASETEATPLSETETDDPITGCDSMMDIASSPSSVETAVEETSDHSLDRVTGTPITADDRADSLDSGEGEVETFAVEECDRVDSSEADRIVVEPLDSSTIEPA